MYDELFSRVESQRSSKYLDLLTTEQRADLEQFVSWLVREHSFKLESARSYRSNLARAIYKSTHNVELNSDERSAVRKFKSFMS